MNAVVSDAKLAAETGGQVVDEAMQAVNRIEQSSKQIADIISVIEEIAFQTNLLALNAGVEAARAGEAGRGFAVVASEVRSLAQHASEASKEIKALIKTSGEHVASGVKLVSKSGEALKHIVGRVVEINNLVNQMSQSMQQQSSGIEEVNTAVTNMDQVTQQNAAMVEESTAASRNLAKETEELADLISFFEVGIQAATVQRQAAPAPRSFAKRPKIAGRTAAKTRGALALAQESAQPAASDDWEEF